LTDIGSRLPLGADVWQDTWLTLPQDFPADAYIDVFTGARTGARARDGGRLQVGELLADFPIALLECTAAEGGHKG
jgi:maltooligosyltrehalose synthase